MHRTWVTLLGRTRCRCCSRRPRSSPMWGSRFVGARAVGPWVGEQKPLGKTPQRGNPCPESTYLSTYLSTRRKRYRSYIPLSEKTPLFGPSLRVRLCCLLVRLRNGHLSFFREDTIQHSGCNLGRSRRHSYVTSGTKFRNLNPSHRQYGITPGTPIALILCISNRSRGQECVVHNFIASNATVRNILHEDFVGKWHTTWNNVFYNEHKLLDSLPQRHVRPWRVEALQW